MGMEAGMAIASKTFCDICYASHDLDQWIRFFCDNKNFLMRYYRSLFAIFDFFDDFLRLKKLAQINQHEAANNKSNN